MEGGAVKGDAVELSCPFSGARLSKTLEDVPQPRRPDGQRFPDQLLFYGLINECIEEWVLLSYGSDQWQEIRDVAGLQDIDEGDFLPTQVYRQETTFDLIDAIAEVLGIDAASAWESIGWSFVTVSLVRKGYLGLLRVHGKTLMEFMSSMDKLHGLMKKNGMPALAPPSFRCSTDEEEGFLLEYWSFRKGLAPFCAGMVGGVGYVLFNQEVTLTPLRSSCDETGVSYTMFRVAENPIVDKLDGRVHGEDEPSPEEASEASPPRATSVFEQHSYGALPKTSVSSRGEKKKQEMHHQSRAELQALLQVLKDRVAKMEHEGDVVEMEKNFGVEDLISLLSIPDRSALDALLAVFRPPFTTAIHVPTKAFLPHNSTMSVAEYHTPSMHSDVTGRGHKVDPFHPPLVGAHPHDGWLGVGAASVQRKVDVQVCVFPKLLDVRVLHSIARNPHVELFTADPCRAIVDVVWTKVRIRYLCDVVFEILVLSLMASWTYALHGLAEGSEDSDTLGPAQLAGFWLCVAKELCETAFVTREHFKHGWLWECLQREGPRSWMRISLVCILLVLHYSKAGVQILRVFLAWLVLVRWFRLLYMFRAYRLFGTKLLPIINTLQSIVAFCVVLLFYLCGFLHALYSLTPTPFLDVVLLAFRLGIMSDFQLQGNSGALFAEDERMDIAVLVWFFACALLLAVFMMNVVIGILGDSYDMEKERAEASFLKARADIVFVYALKMWRVSTPLGLYARISPHLKKKRHAWLAGANVPLLLRTPLVLAYLVQRAFVCEWHVDPRAHHDAHHHDSHASRDTPPADRLQSQLQSYREQEPLSTEQSTEELRKVPSTVGGACERSWHGAAANRSSREGDGKQEAGVAPFLWYCTTVDVSEEEQDIGKLKVIERMIEASFDRFKAEMHLKHEASAEEFKRESERRKAESEEVLRRCEVLQFSYAQLNAQVEKQSRVGAKKFNPVSDTSSQRGGPSPPPPQPGSFAGSFTQTSSPMHGHARRGSAFPLMPLAGPGGRRRSSIVPFPLVWRQDSDLVRSGSGANAPLPRAGSGGTAGSGAGLARPGSRPPSGAWQPIPELRDASGSGPGSDGPTPRAGTGAAAAARANLNLNLNLLPPPLAGTMRRSGSNPSGLALQAMPESIQAEKDAEAEKEEEEAAAAAAAAAGKEEEGGLSEGGERRKSGASIREPTEPEGGERREDGSCRGPTSPVFAVVI